jgi:hypothetical protein
MEVILILLIALVIVGVSLLIWSYRKDRYMVVAGTRGADKKLRNAYARCMSRCEFIDANDNLHSNFLCVRACDTLFNDQINAMPYKS